MEIAWLFARFYTHVMNGVAEIAESNHLKGCPHTVLAPRPFTQEEIGPQLNVVDDFWSRAFIPAATYCMLINVVYVINIVNTCIYSDLTCFQPHSMPGVIVSVI
jgi:hypothetical protein